MGRWRGANGDADPSRRPYVRGAPVMRQNGRLISSRGRPGSPGFRPYRMRPTISALTRGSDRK